MVCTQIQPSKGISAWKNAKTPAMVHILPTFILFSFIPFAKDTENASIASPKPNIILTMKNSGFINSPFVYIKRMVLYHIPLAKSILFRRITRISVDHKAREQIFKHKVRYHVDHLYKVLIPALLSCKIHKER